MTQTDRVLRHMKEFGNITAAEAMKDYGIQRLAARISDLKRSGKNISTTIESGKNRYGEPTHYAVYRLIDNHDKS